MLRIFKNQSFKNSSWTTLRSVVYPLLMMLATPVFIQKLGTEDYGIWILVNSIVASLGVMNFGLGSATVKYIAKYRALKSDEKIFSVINATFVVYLGISVIIILIGIFGVRALYNLNLFTLDEGSKDLTFSIIPIGFVLFGIRLIEQLLLSVYEGFERYDISARISILSKVILLVIQLTVALLGFNLVIVFVSATAVSFVTLLIVFYLLNKRYKGIYFFKKPQKEILKEIFGFGIWSWFQSLNGIFSNEIDKFIVASFGGVTVLAFYSIGKLVSGHLHGVFAAASSWIFPRISGKVERKESVMHLYYDLQFIIIICGIICVSIIFYFREFLFTLWLGEETYLNSKDYIEIFLFYNVFSVSTIIPYYFLNGAGHVRLNTIFIFFSTAVTVVSMIGFYQLIGIIGLPLGRLVSPAITSVISRTYTHLKVLKESDFFAGAKMILPSLSAAALLYIPYEYEVSLIWYVVLLSIFLLSLYYTFWKKIKMIKHFKTYIIK